MFIAGSIMASRLLVNRDIKLRKNPGDVDFTGFLLSVVLLNFDNSSFLLLVGTTAELENIYEVLLLNPGFGFDFDGMLINYAIKKI